MELPTDSTTLAGYLEQSADRIAGSLRCAEVKNAQKTVKAMIDGVFKNLQTGAVGEHSTLQKTDLDKARTAFESKVNALLASQTETTARLEEWGEKDYEDKALVNAFFELGCKAIAIQMMMNGDKIAVNGRLLYVKCFLDFFRKKSGEASYTAVLDYMETYGSGKDSKEETGNRRSFLRGRAVTLAFFEAIFDTGPDLDLSSDTGKSVFLSSYAQTKKRWPFHSTQWDKAKIHVVNPAGATEEISARQVLEAWEIRPEQGVRTLQSIVDEMCREVFGFSLVELRNATTTAKQRADRDVGRKNRFSERGKQDSGPREWTEADFHDTKLVKTAVAHVLGTKKPNWSDAGTQQTLIKMPITRLKSGGVVRINDHEPLSFIRILNAWDANDDLAAWMKILKEVFKIPDVVNRRRRLMPPGPGRTALERLTEEE